MILYLSLNEKNLKNEYETESIVNNLSLSTSKSDYKYSKTIYTYHLVTFLDVINSGGQKYC